MHCTKNWIHKCLPKILVAYDIGNPIFNNSKEKKLFCWALVAWLVISFKAAQRENLNKLLFLFSTLKFELNHYCHYSNFFLSNNAVYLWNLKKKQMYFEFAFQTFIRSLIGWRHTYTQESINECLSFWILWGCQWKVKQLTAPVQRVFIV